MRGRDIFTIPDSEKIFGYRQSYSMPYIGLVGSWRYQDIEIGGIFILNLATWCRRKVTTTIMPET
ncbi:MAG: omptin family outer membrane protease [Symbiopectobacterium sp.]|uniref:omptin family outer membrane protease n=1 Tax=Symbiopectobacterium sp. TaxID=2952789 RepID=UPI0039E80500